MMTYEVWSILYSERIYNWTEDAKYLIYQCWVVGVNPEWVIARLENNEYIPIYQKFIINAKQAEPSEIIADWVIKIRRRLYRTCMNLIAEYCLD